jgi:hypothetical protein
VIRDAFVTPTRAALAAGAALALTATVPASAAAPSGGATAPTATSTAAAPAATPKRKSAPRPLIRVRTERAAGLVGRKAVYAGTVARHRPGQRVRLELRNRSGWRVVDRARIAKNGRFRLTTTIHRIGDDRAARVRILERGSRKGAVRRVERVHGFRRSFASYYGPGLYGFKMACGGRLSPGTVGVAHKSLPCGTKLTFRLGGREVQARVVDRGPYVGGREFDLTAATKARLGFGSTGTVLVDR